MESSRPDLQTVSTMCRALLATLLVATLALAVQVALVAADPSENPPSSSSSEGGSVTHYSYNRGYNNGYNSYGSYGGGGYGLGDAYPISDYDEEWAKMSGRIPRPKCVDIPSNLSLCQNIGYEKMLLPNLLQHDSLSEVTQQARSWVPLVGLHCHPDTKVFLCSLFSPVCLDREIYPCRTLCESVRDNCLHRMIPYGFDWPEMLHCDKFPMDNDMCIKLIHDVKPDNNCSACKHPMTYASIIDNYCRAEFVSRVKIERTETRGVDRALLLKKSKRYYKKENITNNERSNMAPLIRDGASCECNAISDTSKRFLLMGAHSGEDLMVNYVVEFPRKNKEFRKAFKDIRKGNVCKNIIQELSTADVDKKVEKEKDDGICVACKIPTKYVTIVENYCLADFVLRVRVSGIEARDGHQALLMKKGRKNFKKGTISKKEEKAMIPLLDGKEDCKCELVEKKKSRFLVFGSKRDDKYYINYVIEFAKQDKEFNKALKTIRKGSACLGILRGEGLGVDDAESKPKNSKSKVKKRKKGKSEKKGKKKRKGKEKKPKPQNSDTTTKQA